MRFGGIVISWLVAAVVGYACASAASTFITLNQLASLGAEVSLSTRLSSTWADILGLTSYLMVIAIGFLAAFYIASLVKAFIPVLAPIAYPIAGAGAIMTALELMKWQFDIYPIAGAQDPIGYWMQIAAGAIGGLVFELLRPKTA